MLGDRRAPHDPQQPSLTPLMLDMNQPVWPLVVQLISQLGEQAGFSERTLRKRAHDDLYVLGKQSSPCGDLVEYVTVVGDSGEFTLEYVNPFSLLYLFAASSLCCFQLLENV